MATFKLKSRTLLIMPQISMWTRRRTQPFRWRTRFNSLVRATSSTSNHSVRSTERSPGLQERSSYWTTLEQKANLSTKPRPLGSSSRHRSTLKFHAQWVHPRGNQTIKRKQLQHNTTLKWLYHPLWRQNKKSRLKVYCLTRGGLKTQIKY